MELCPSKNLICSSTVAIASAISVHLAIRRTDFELANGTALRKRRVLAELAKPLDMGHQLEPAWVCECYLHPYKSESQKRSLRESL